MLNPSIIILAAYLSGVLVAWFPTPSDSGLFLAFNALLLCTAVRFKR